MTAYLDEYNPNARGQNYHVQSDPQKLKYYNIQSCIAVAMYPSAAGYLVGVHLTEGTSHSSSEMKSVRDELRAALGNVRKCTAYLVANYREYHATSRLKRDLKKIAASVMLCHVTGGPDKAADIDVKIEVNATLVLCSVRSHAHVETHPGTPTPVDADRPPGGFLPGQPRSKLVTTGLPWSVATFEHI